MAVGFFHCGTFLLFCAMALLIVASISAPVFHQIALLKVYNGAGSNSYSSFGTFGYCYAAGQCSKAKIGYAITSITGQEFQTTYFNLSLDRVTNAFVLHPIAAGISFIAFIIAAASDHIGFIFASFITAIAFLVSLVVMIIDFVVFGIIKREINNDGTGVAEYGNAIWMVLAATVVLFFATFIVLFSCCTHRRNSNRDAKYAGNGYNGRWWGNRY